MTRRRLLLFGVSVAVVVLSVGVWVFWAQPRTMITRENAARIQVGMTLGEVEAILGGPARNESSGQLKPTGDSQTNDFRFLLALCSGVPEATFHRADGMTQAWTCNTLMVVVAFDLDGRALNDGQCAVCPVPESPIDRLRRWLRL
jgi:hypothetical protein